MVRRIPSKFVLEVFDGHLSNLRHLAGYLKIYLENIAPENRTDTNELVSFLQNPLDDRRIIYLGLRYADAPYGFASLMFYPREWHDHGSFKRFVPTDDPYEYCWWPQTSDVLTCQTPERDFRRTSRIDWREIRKTAERARHKSRWKEFSIKGLGNFSLPELVFRAQDYFFEQVLYGQGKLGPVDKTELAEIMDKISAIRVPKCAPKGARVVHYYMPGEGTYAGFEITSVSMEGYSQSTCYQRLGTQAIVLFRTNTLNAKVLLYTIGRLTLGVACARKSAGTNER